MMDVFSHVWKKESASRREATAEGGSVLYGTNRGGLSKDRLKSESRQMALGTCSSMINHSETPESIAISERPKKRSFDRSRLTYPGLEPTTTEKRQHSIQ